MSRARTHTNEVQQHSEPARLPEHGPTRQYEPEPVHALIPQTACRRGQVDANGFTAAELLALQRAAGNRQVQRLVARDTGSANNPKQPALAIDNCRNQPLAVPATIAFSPLDIRQTHEAKTPGSLSISTKGTPTPVVQRALTTRREVRQEIVRIIGAVEIPLPVIEELLERSRLRRRLLALRRRREQLAQQHIQCFPNGDCGFIGLTQSEFVTRDSRILDQILRLQRQVVRSHSAPISVQNVGIGIADPLGRNQGMLDALRIAETTYNFEEEEQFRVETHWRQRTGFPQLPQQRPQAGLVYLFVAVISPEDIGANTVAAANTARGAVLGNAAIFNANEDWAGVEEVDSIDGFIGVFARVHAMCQRRGWRVRQIEVFSHGGLDGPMFGHRRLQFNFPGASEPGARSLSSLAVLAFTGDAVVFFRGCRIGAGNFLAAFAQQQGVATYGFAGTTSFSNRPGAFYAWPQAGPAYQLEFPGSETWSQIIGRHPTPTPPHGYVPERTVVPVQRKASADADGRLGAGPIAQAPAFVVMSDNERGTSSTPGNVAAWLRTRLPDMLEIVAQRWQIQPGADSGIGHLKVALRTGRSRNILLNSFQRDLSLRRRDFFDALSGLRVAFRIGGGSEYATLRSTEAAWRQGNWESQLVPVDLLRRGGPVTMSATVSDGEQAIGTLATSTYILAPGVAPEVARRVLGYRNVIEEVCRELGMRPDLVMAIMSLESGGRPEAGGTRGPYFGLMQASRVERQQGESLEEHQTRIREYQRNIRQQIVDGVQVFLDKKQAMARMGFAFNEPMTEDDILTIEIAYAAGEGTVQVALRRARNAGRSAEWHQPEFLLAAVVETGAHHPPFAIRRGTAGWTGEQLRAELIDYCGLSEAEADTRYRRRDGGWNVGTMREALTQRVNQRRLELKGWIRSRTATTLPEIETEDRWVYRSAQQKYENLTGAYMNQLRSYRRYYEAVLTGHWVTPVSSIYVMEEEVVTAFPGEELSPPSTESAEAEAGAE